MSKPKIVIVDDESEIVEFLTEAASMCGFEPTGVSDFNSFRAVYESSEVDVIVLDLMMPDTDGLEFLNYLGSRNCTASIVLMSGYDRRVLKTARQLALSEHMNLVATLEKPISFDDFESVLRDAVTNGAPLTSDHLHEAMERDEVVLFYQPKVCLQNGNGAVKEHAIATDGDRKIARIGPAAINDVAVDDGAGGTRRDTNGSAAHAWTVDGFESLMRWRHPKLGLLTPDSFLPLAERSGVIRPLTDYLFRQCLSQASVWKTDGLDARYSINLSATLLDDSHMPDRFAEWAQETGIDPDHIVIEITESAAIADLKRSMHILGRFRLKGFQLSMDDFGTGYSSLVHLYRLPFNELKIDRTFVAEAAIDTDAAGIVRLIRDFAQMLGLRVCAEGVEDEETAQILTDAGCDLAQGYYFSRPLPSETLWTRMAVA